MPVPEVRSPCINICRLDAQRVCVGCLRSVDEIAGWRALSDAQRRAVLARLEAARAAMADAGAR